MPQLALKAFAKVNLGLSIIGRRDDGYHELRTIYQTISLADSVEVTLARGRRAVQLETSGFAVPEGRANLAVRAAEAFLEHAALPARVGVTLRKKIPPGSGLGGASSDAAAVLRALSRLAPRQVSAESLLSMAVSLGADVPFFLVGGRALGVGRGDEVYPLPEERRYAVLVLFPGEGMSTAEAYRRLRAPRLTALQARPTIELFNARVIAAEASVANDFEPLLFRRFPQLATAKEMLLRSAASAASLSGSGSALFALFENTQMARAAADNWRASGMPAMQVFLARTISRREYAAQFPPQRDN
jgi:4-diphosphocytidyl-2-C-methyl-D-erythritol kinase